jgi:flavin-dependent dehydrogenase
VHATVLGAGPAGASAAIALARAGVETQLVDPYQPAERPLGEGLPAAGGAHLRSLGLWDSFRAERHLPCSGFLSRWGRAEPDYRPALLDPRGPSWQLDRPRFDRMLRDAAAAAAGAAVPWRLTAARRDRRRWLLHFTDGATVRRVRTDFVVDATGRRRAFARLTGAAQRADDSLVCVVGLVADPDPDNATTVVETARHGWWYASRIPGGAVVAALFTDAAQANRHRATTPPGWRALLPRTGLVGARIGGPDAELLAPLRAAVAASSRLQRCGGQGWLAVGDAACAHDPLSSRGLHDALAGGLDAADCVARALDGDVEAPLRSAARTAAGYDRYRRELTWFYAQERRFADEPFWRNRITR